MNFIKVIAGLALLFILAAGGFVFWIYSSLQSPKHHGKAGQYITIERGSTPGAIVDKLAAEGILQAAFPAKLYLRTVGNAEKLQAGEYDFKSPISAMEVLKELEKGETQTIRLTVPEGFTRFDIAKRIVEQFPQEPPVTEDQVLLLMEDVSSIQDIAPNARNLEGYMYPSTYSFPRGTTPEQVIARMVAQFKKIWKPEWQNRAKELGRTPHEIVTIASLVETESKFEEERPIVASVIYNRLEKNIPLGIDQTAVYVAKMENRWDGTIHKSDLDADSPYNTRKFGGIPPGPISSVSENAIVAALNPDKTDFIYYVLNVQANDGSHHFFATAGEFERAKAEYQRWLQEQRRIKREQEAARQ